MDFKFETGKVFPREGKCPVRIIGVTPTGRYRTKKVLHRIRESKLVQMFPDEILEVGKLLKFPNGKIIELVGRDFLGNWDNTYPHDILEFSEEELERLAADANARKVAPSLVTRRESVGKEIFRSQFLPVRTEKREED